MKTFLTAMLVLLLPACRSNPQTGEREPDWPLIQSELTKAREDLASLAPLFVDKPEEQALVDAINHALTETENDITVLLTEGGDPALVVRAALERIPEVALITIDDPRSQERLRVIVAAIRVLLNRVPV